MYSLKKYNMWVATILGFWFWFFCFGFVFLVFVSFAFPFFSIIALQGTNKTANVFFTYTVFCFPLIVVKIALFNFVARRAKQLGSRSKNIYIYRFRFSFPVHSRIQSFQLSQEEKSHPVFKIPILN